MDMVITDYVIFDKGGFGGRFDHDLQLANNWFLDCWLRGQGIRKPVGAVKAPTGPLTPGSEATNILDNGETGRLG